MHGLFEGMKFSEFRKQQEVRSKKKVRSKRKQQEANLQLFVAWSR